MGSCQGHPCSKASLWTDACFTDETSPPQMHPLSQDPLPLPGPDQLVSNVIHDVGVVEATALVGPPALDVDAGLTLQVGQVEVVPGVRGQGEVEVCGRER
jgi:hypothetical protein